MAWNGGTPDNSLEAPGLWPSTLLPSGTSFGTPEKKTFSVFFFLFLPNFGDDHAPDDVTTFLGEGHVAP